MAMEWRGSALPLLVALSMLAGFAVTLVRFG
jgi:hypothetical protein